MKDRLSGNLSDEEYLHRLRRKIAAERVPYTGSIELTHRCNLKCVHCYVGDQRAISKRKGSELDAERWKDIIDQIADAECMDLLITGGEPLLRKDFPEIYSHAKRRGMIVSIFTNATRVTPSVLELFADLPPYFVEVSIYGAGPKTHDRVTQVKGSFAKTMQGIRSLLAHDVHVGLKTVLLSLNQHEFRDMEKLAGKLGVKWRLDSAVFPCLPHSDSGGRPNRCSLFSAQENREAASKSPLSLRVDPRSAVALEFSSGVRAKAMRETLAKMSGRKADGKLYTCGAGLTGFHIDPYGNLQPCMMTTGYRQTVVGSSFERAWKKVGQVRNVPAPAGYVCHVCNMLPICSGCPALFDLENGAPNLKSDYICTLAQIRYDSILNAQG